MDVAMENTLCDNLTPALSEQFNEVIDWLCKVSVFKDFFSSDSGNVERRACLFERLKTYLQGGHDFAVVLTKNDTKNDLLWDFRRWAVRMVGTNGAALEECNFTTTVINEDADNYHAWSQRRWVFQLFGGEWEDEPELDYCAKILGEDSFNRFAWDQRYFVVTRCIQKIDEAKRNMDVDDELQFEEVGKLEEAFERKRSKEVADAIKVIKADPGNQYPWSHIRGLYYVDCESIFFDPGVLDAIRCVLEDGKDCVRVIKGSGHAMNVSVSSYMDARGIINALNELLDPADFGFWSSTGKGRDKKLRDVIDALFVDFLYPESCPSEFTIHEKIVLILKQMERASTDYGLAWTNVGDKIYLKRHHGFIFGAEGIDSDYFDMHGIESIYFDTTV